MGLPCLSRMGKAWGSTRNEERDAKGERECVEVSILASVCLKRVIKKDSFFFA